MLLKGNANDCRKPEVLLGLGNLFLFCTSEEPVKSPHVIWMFWLLFFVLFLLGVGSILRWVFGFGFGFLCNDRWVVFVGQGLPLDYLGLIKQTVQKKTLKPNKAQN